MIQSVIVVECGGSKFGRSQCRSKKKTIENKKGQPEKNIEDL